MVELVKIQSELKAPKNQFNNFGKYKYRSCEDILEGLKPHLLEHNCYITLTDDVIECSGVLMIKATATITNKKGDQVTVSAFAGIDPNKKGMDISQTFGSSSSYARKYALNGLFAIDDTKDADTQNNSATPTKKATKPANKPTATNTKVKPSLGTNTGGYNKAWLAYRDADSNDKRNSIKQSILNAYADANDVINKLDSDLKEVLKSK
jgi:hypothetical protein